MAIYKAENLGFGENNHIEFHFNSFKGSGVRIDINGESGVVSYQDILALAEALKSISKTGFKKEDKK